MSSPLPLPWYIFRPRLFLPRKRHTCDSRTGVKKSQFTGVDCTSGRTSFALHLHGCRNWKSSCGFARKMRDQRRFVSDVSGRRKRSAHDQWPCPFEVQHESQYNEYADFLAKSKKSKKNCESIHSKVQRETNDKMCVRMPDKITSCCRHLRGSLLTKRLVRDRQLYQLTSETPDSTYDKRTDCQALWPGVHEAKQRKSTSSITATQMSGSMTSCKTFVAEPKAKTS